MGNKRIAVIYFPGMNCENETAHAIRAVGMSADIIRWNMLDEVAGHDGYVLPGGWSYEDRVRAGVVAARDPVVSIIKEEAEEGKPILGICNGAQILVESGMIPGISSNVQAALAPNINPFIRGYYCTWVHLRISSVSNAFTSLYKKGEVVRMPIAHGEGRFTTTEEGLVDYLEEKGMISMKYTDKNGHTLSSFPFNPNGALNNIAAVSNEEGNVMAMMPHPERAFYMRQVPCSHKEGLSPAPGRRIFESMKKSLEKD